MTRRLLPIFALALTVAGCTGAAGGGLGAVLIAMSFALVLGACLDSTNGQSDAGALPDVEAECMQECGPGQYIPCNVSCNYGLWDDDDDDLPDTQVEVEGDAECVYDCGGVMVPCNSSCNYWDVPEQDVRQELPPPDVTLELPPNDVPPEVAIDVPEDHGPDTPDVPEVAECDGYWEACCVDGHVDMCCCPAGVACNYGWYDSCGDGVCVFPGDACPGEADADADMSVEVEVEPDAGPDSGPEVDAGTETCDGYWEPCCQDGTVGECCCPLGAACNYGWFDTCEDGTCAFPGGCE